jgi:hypothetical protein
MAIAIIKLLIKHFMLTVMTYNKKPGDMALTGMRGEGGTGLLCINVLSGHMAFTSLTLRHLARRSNAVKVNKLLFQIKAVV